MKNPAWLWLMYCTTYCLSHHVHISNGQSNSQCSTPLVIIWVQYLDLFFHHVAKNRKNPKRWLIQYHITKTNPGRVKGKENVQSDRSKSMDGSSSDSWTQKTTIYSVGALVTYLIVVYLYVFGQFMHGLLETVDPIAKNKNTLSNPWCIISTD